jgi:OOP family OmpA-OmpF porin
MMDRTTASPRPLVLLLCLAAAGWACGPSSPDPVGPGGGAGGGGGGDGTRVAAGEGDRDGDGIPDSVDQCPEAPETMNGIDDEDGCPESDQDGDGIVGSADKCPTDPEDFDGDADEDGCPDVDGDGDGVADAIDRCPSEKETMNGYEDADGCPDTVPDPVKEFTGVVRDIEFAAASATIQRRSFRVLDRAAAVLKKYPSVRIEIQGHTDNTGSRAQNIALSQERADAVRDYLIKKGIFPERLVAKGYGPDQPTADNSTKRGQAENRRVEFKLISASAP